MNSTYLQQDSPKRRQTIILVICLVMALVAFVGFIFPNRVASENLSMVQMFQPDEGSALPSVFKMIAPTASLNQALRSFIFYDYYYYGFPYFGLSALILLPLRFLGRLADMPLVMLVLRQSVSVLPMLAALLILVYMQDGFRTYRSPVLFLFLLSVPAVVQNNLWWHPDGITFLLVVLTLLFLKRDDLHFGWFFLLAAITCGIATAAKLIGVYFFLPVALALLLGLILKKASWKRLLGMGLAFIFVMAVAYLVANPFLLSHWARTAYINIFHKQTGLLSDGYGVIYEKGLLAAWPLMHESYGEWIFLLVTLGAAVWGAWKGPQRYLHALILAWFLPLTVVVLWVSHFKFQYWLPVALPLFSSLVLLLPGKGSLGLSKLKLGNFKKLSVLVPLAALSVVVVQFFLFAWKDGLRVNSSLHRADNNPRIQFYGQASTALAPISSLSLHVYYDYRLYVPDTSGWSAETNYDLLEYGYIGQGDFDVLLLLEQRIRDYLAPDVTGIDPASFTLSQAFYRDAEAGSINGYHLVFRNSVGLVFVREDLYSRNFSP
jgi:hypothetical protein